MTKNGIRSSYAGLCGTRVTGHLVVLQLRMNTRGFFFSIHLTVKTTLKLITQDETSTSQNRLLTTKIVGDLSISTTCRHQLLYMTGSNSIDIRHPDPKEQSHPNDIGTRVWSWTPSGTGFSSVKRELNSKQLETLSAN